MPRNLAIFLAFHHAHQRLAILRRNQACMRFVRGVIDLHSQKRETLADPAPHFDAMFADAARKNQQIQPPQHRRVSCNRSSG